MSRTSSQFKNRGEYYKIILRAFAAQFCKSCSLVISSLFNSSILNNTFISTKNNYKRLSHRCNLVFLIFFTLINLSSAQTNCSSPDRLIFSGSYDCVTIALSEDQTNCALLPSTSQTLPVPAGTTIEEAIEGLFDYVKVLKYNTCAATQLCADGTPKKAPSIACNDNNPNTTNDVIQADGCTCAGTTPPPICDNVLNGGTISKSCNNGIISLTASTPVTGGTGAIEYIWLKSTQGCPGDPAQAIAGARGESYTILAGSVAQTTYFARCARRVGCTVWSGSSNCITVLPNECTTTPNTCNFAPCLTATISVLASPGWTGYASWTLSNMPSSGWTTGAFQYSSDGGTTWTSWSTTFSPASPAIGMVTYADHYQYRVTIYNSAGTCSQTLTWTFTNPPCGICGDGLARRVPGTACNDNNPNTTNDIVQPDGCSCAGTPVNGNICDFAPCLAVSDIYTQWATPDKYATWTLAQMPSSGWTNTAFQYSKDGGTTWLNVYQKFSPTVLSITSVPYGMIYQEDPYIYRATFQNTAGTCTKTINWSAAMPIYCTPCADGSPKKVPGTACNDNNPNTVNDVIQADGCSCAGISVNPSTCNYTPCFKVSNITNIGGNGYATWTLSQMPSSGWTTTAFQYSQDGGSSWASWSVKFSPTTLSVGMVNYGTNYKFRVIFQNSAGTCTQTIIWDALFPYCGSTSLCDNVTSGGTVSKVCNSTNGTISLNETTPASGGSGQLEYIWLRSTTICPGDPALAIPGETSANLTVNASTITQTTYFARCVRRVGCTVWTGSSNCITINPNECSPCSNVTFGGNISKVCNNNGTISLNETAPASGGSGQLEYIWLRSTTICPGDPALAIPGATSANLTVNASTITQTTYFARCVRRVGCTVWTGSSNCITVSPNECAKGSIGDMTYCDNNSNGIMDAGDTPQSGVQVQLCNAGNVIIATATTDVQGKYLFPNLAAGIYVVKFPATITGGKTITTNNPITINLGAGQNYLDADAGYKPDCTTNPVNATITGANGVVCPNATTTLTASGGIAYKWSNGATTSSITVGAGTYSVTVSNAAGCSQVVSKTISSTPTTITLTNCPQNITLTSSNNNCVVATWTSPSFTANCGTPSITSNYTSGYCFPIGTTTVTYTVSLNGVSKTCSFTVTVTPTPKGSIGDYVFKDKNCNGIQDAGDSPLSGVLIQLKSSNGLTIASTISNSNGQYLFSNLVSGSYQVCFTTPNGCVPTLKNSTGSNADNDSNIAENGTTSIINLGIGQNITNIDAGFKNIDNASLGDRVWEDINGNGIQDNNEIGIPNINVFLIGTDINGNSISRNTITNNVGQYIFTNLPAGTYKVSFIIPSAYIVTSKDKGGNDLFDSDIESGTNMTGSYTLISGQSNLSVDAGLYRPACIGDFVFVDTDRDGIQDVGEIGYANIAVTLSGLTNAGMIVNLTTLTDLNGNYKFNNLRLGKYQIQIITPNGFALTIANQGSDEAKDSDIDPSTGKSTEVSVSSGQSYLLLDVGIFNKFNTPCSGDLTAPTFSNVPNSVTIECGQSYSLPTPLVSDNCSPYSGITLSTTTNTEIVGKCPVKKIITRTWKATDQNGNTTTVSRSVTFIDTQAPVISGIPADVTIQCGQNIPVPPPYGANGIQAFDNCDGLLTNKITFSEIYFGGGCQSNATSNGKSKIICTWTVKDACGNAAVKSWTITILPFSASRESSNTDKKPTLKDFFEDPTIERSIIDSSKDNVLVYPNPSNGYFSIEARKSKIEKITVLDIHGKALRQVENYENLSTLNLDLSNENNGVYLLLIQVNNGLITKKISIKR